MYRMIEDFIADWGYEKEMTQKVFANLTKESLSARVTDDGRELGFIAWHIVTSIGEMIKGAGIPLEGFDENADRPENVEDIAALLEEFDSKIKEEITGKWTNDTLTEEVSLYGQPWKKGQLLKATLGHTIHHRGQMTVLMRQAGLKVPGVYGPSKEEWAQYGMPTAK